MHKIKNNNKKHLSGFQIHLHLLKCRFVNKCLSFYLLMVSSQQTEEELHPGSD